MEALEEKNHGVKHDHAVDQCKTNNEVADNYIKELLNKCEKREISEETFKERKFMVKRLVKMVPGA